MSPGCDAVANVVGVILLIGLTIAVLGVVFVWIVDVLPSVGPSDPTAPVVTFSTFNHPQVLRAWNQSDAIIEIMVVDGDVRVDEIEIEVARGSGGEFSTYPLSPSSITFLGSTGDPSIWEPGESVVVSENGVDWNTSTCRVRITYTPTSEVLMDRTIEIERSVTDTTGPMIGAVRFDAGGGCPTIGELTRIVATVYDLPVAANRSVKSVTMNATTLGNGSAVSLVADDGGAHDWNENGVADPYLWGVELTIDVELGTRTAWVDFEARDNADWIGTRREMVCIEQP